MLMKTPLLFDVDHGDLFSMAVQDEEKCECRFLPLR